jgi:acetyl-CoA C-acetyltransferase
MKEVVIAGYLRTAQSRSRPREPGRDWFHKLRGDDLVAKVMPALMERLNLKPQELDDFITGSAMGVSENWTYGGRVPVFLANFPETVPAKFVDQQCGSSMAAIHIAYMEIATGSADIVMASGFEHMTRVPMGASPEALTPNMALMSDAKYRHWDIATTMSMGLTAEKLFAQTNCTREDMDAWGARSHQLATKAQEEGFFDAEILPVEAEQADGSIVQVDTDQAVRPDATVEGMASLKPSFTQDGAITAGNSSPLNAGASCVVLMSKETAKAKGIEPLATIRSIGFAGVDPTVMGRGPVPASQKALKAAGLSAQDIDYWEINEAFCIVALNCIQELGLDPEKVNVMGGGTAIGHPLGASGCRLVGTLARILDVRQARYGCANACCGGGQGVATVIEREDYDW